MLPTEYLAYKVYTVDVERILLEDPELLPFPEDSQECIISSLGLHWINDLLGLCTTTDVPVFRTNNVPVDRYFDSSPKNFAAGLPVVAVHAWG